VTKNGEMFIEFTPPEESPLDGATLKFTTEETHLTLEADGQIAELQGTFTPRMVPEVGVPEYPVVLTTVEIL
jgi:hypothetical protein